MKVFDITLTESTGLEERETEWGVVKQLEESVFAFLRKNLQAIMLIRLIMSLCLKLLKDVDSSEM